MSRLLYGEVMSKFRLAVGADAAVCDKSASKRGPSLVVAAASRDGETGTGSDVEKKLRLTGIGY
jgi:hypothetical protein